MGSDVENGEGEKRRLSLGQDSVAVGGLVFPTLPGLAWPQVAPACQMASHIASLVGHSEASKTKRRKANHRYTFLDCASPGPQISLSPDQRQRLHSLRISSVLGRRDSTRTIALLPVPPTDSLTAVEPREFKSQTTHPDLAKQQRKTSSSTAIMADTHPSQLSPLKTDSLSLQNTSPPTSTASSPRSNHLSTKRSRSPLSIDLSSLPPLSQPAPPSNTLLITRLDDSKIFHPASLATIRQHISDIAPLNSFSPLKSMHRIIVSFHDTDAALAVRQVFDGRAVLGETTAKCYFGEPTPIDPAMKYLDRPDAGKLFFISPPPSPPVGWEMRNEDPPNKQVHAEDLATKLARLSGNMVPLSPTMDDSASEDDSKTQYTAEGLAKLKATHRRGLSAENSPVAGGAGDGASPRKEHRSRSSTLIYDPVAHGDSPALPAVMLETEDDSEVELEDGDKRILEHTARPPVELMEH